MITYACMIGIAFGFTIVSRDNKTESLINRSGKAFMSSEGKAVDFKGEEITPGVKIFTDKSNNKVLDIEGSRTNLIFYARHGGANQRFSLIKDEGSGYYIKSGDKCIERGSTGNLYRTTCSSKPQQKFDVVYTPEDPEYKPPVEVPVATESSPTPNPSPQILIFNGGKKHRPHSHFNVNEESSSIFDESNGLSTNGLIV
ncbi:hypothetical protein EROM_081710 [Encephalitozoon romaleae SJ-2008]|uniref:Ricin B lectin domain-containing protein n=1 Tax=Encephalitozoon romaleae (strain SJ-2008) TaxID=1178016 RepID=I7AT09_ENCRO|nr:hypothetical protein EROM_081710 [Encephalitozoon romaleae SJ-2008]AFN83587.1 hypothetical protein EROM_081710 [Encephalitozoon romaleae SJ-2008]